MNFSHLANKLRSKITKFSGILSKDLDKTAGRFVKEAIYGIMASQSVMLTEIGRQLESSVPLKKIEERFSRQLIKAGIWDRLHERILSLASNRVKEKTLLILDLSDLKKKYALGDGLSNIFSRYPGRLQKQSEIRQSQLSFGFG